MRFITLLAILIALAVLAVPALAGPNITDYNPTSDPSSSAGATRKFTVVSNESVNIEFFINETSVQYTRGRYSATYSNTSAAVGTGAWNVTARVNNSHGAAVYMWNWTVNEAAPAATAVSPSTSGTVADNNATIARMFNITVNKTTANTTWYIDGVAVQYNSSQPVANYTNYTAGLGTYTVTATVNTTAGGTGNTITWTWSVPSRAITAASITTNLSTSATSRALYYTNSTLNFSITSPGNVTFWNLTFPAGFNFTAIESANITNNTGVTTITTTSTLLSIQNTTKQGLNNSVPVYFNLTGSIRTPSTPGAYTITVTTDKDTTGTSVTLHVRNDSIPFYVLSNNSVFTVGTETYDTTALSTTVPLTGAGVANLTLFAPILTGQANITKGYTASNATVLKAVNASGNASVIIYVVTDGTVTDPVVVVKMAKELQSNNLPAAIIALGGIGTLVYLYRKRKRSR